MGWCSDPTSEAHGGIGCTNKPSLCWECHNTLVQNAISDLNERKNKEEEARYTEYRKDAILDAVAFANWYSKWIGNHGGGGDAVFYYDRWLKERGEK